MTDEDLMMKYRQGEESAFVQLYEKYNPLVYAYIKRRLRASEAEDFFQKVWRQLHEKRHLYERQPFAPWFFVMIKHLLIDEYRSLARRGEREKQSELLEKLYADPVTDQLDISDILELLPQSSRELVVKYYLEGLSYEELEQSTGLSQTGLRQRLSRAMRGLKTRLQGSEP
jgi:RNA polymerase sigma-70 factor, ECF subfamily